MLHQPHVVRVLDYGFRKSRGPYLVMKLLPNAQALVDAGREIPHATRITWIGQLLLALISRRRRIIHRDIRPSNLQAKRDCRVIVPRLG